MCCLMFLKRHIVKILLSAFDCAPDTGSEPGVGWNWAAQLALAGHDVWVFTGGDSKQKIEQYIQRGGVIPDHLTFVYLDLLGWGIWGKDNLRAERTHNYIWQLLVWFRARKWHRKIGFDIAHHITWGGLRCPSLMGCLGIPFVYGPLGGGEFAPAELVRRMPWQGRLMEMARLAASRLIWLDPFISLSYFSADLILAKTEDTVKALPPRFRKKALVRQEIGISSLHPASAISGSTLENETLELLFAGRLLSMKGLDLAFEAIKNLLDRGERVNLTVIGDGPDKRRLQALARTLDISKHIRWIGRIPQHELFAAYGRYDAFLFPSLHDSSGNVVLEAMSYGLPVVCLNLGGPPIIVERAGIVIDPKGKTADLLVEDLSRGIHSLFSDKLRERLGQLALERAENYIWPKVVNEVYTEIADRLNLLEALPEGKGGKVEYE